MAESGGGNRLLTKRGPDRRVLGQLPVQHLDGDGPGQNAVVTLPDVDALVALDELLESVPAPDDACFGCDYFTVRVQRDSTKPAPITRGPAWAPITAPTSPTMISSRG